MNYGLFSGGQKIRSKILVDVGKIFSVDYKTLIIIGAAVECIHSYSLIHDDLPCMDNDKLRRKTLSTYKIWRINSRVSRKLSLTLSL